MKELAERFQNIEQELAEEFGEFLLFALFLRKDAPNVWDVVVSASWIKADEPSALKQIAETIQNSLSPSEMTKISRVVLIDPENPALEAIQKSIRTEHGLFEVRDSIFFNLPIKHGYIVTSRKDAA